MTIQGILCVLVGAWSRFAVGYRSSIADTEALVLVRSLLQIKSSDKNRSSPIERATWTLRHLAPLQNPSESAWPGLDGFVKTISDQAVARLSNPALIQQGSSFLCGPMSIVAATCALNPEAYAMELAMTLQTGSVGRWVGQVSEKLRTLTPDPEMELPVADFLMGVTLCDLSNIFFDCDPKAAVKAMTYPGKMAEWAQEAFPDCKSNDHWVHRWRVDHWIESVTKWDEAESKCPMFIMVNYLAYLREDYESVKEKDSFFQTIARNFENHWVRLKKVKKKDNLYTLTFQDTASMQVRRLGWFGGESAIGQDVVQIFTEARIKAMMMAAVGPGG